MTTNSPHHKMIQPPNHFSQTLENIPKSGIREFFDLASEKTGEGVISLSVGEPDFKTPLSIRQKTIHHLEEGITKYTSNTGFLSLREGISRYHNDHFQCHYNPNNEILITNGVSEGIDITLRSLLNSKDEVIIPEPNYVAYAPLISLSGGIPVSINTSDTHFIPDIKRVSQKITKKTKAIILCTPNNPTGAVIPKPVLTELVNLAIKHNLWLIADEVYAELCYDTPFTSIASLPNAKNHVILLSGFSKAFAMTGWRLGYICGPTNIIGRTLKMHQYTALCASTIAQLAAIEALKTSFDDLKIMKNTYEKRRNLCIDTFSEIGLTMTKPGGAFYCFPNITSTGLSDKAFATALLEEEKVAVVPGHVFGQGGNNHIRCCFALETEKLIEALDRIKRFINNLK